MNKNPGKNPYINCFIYFALKKLSFWKYQIKHFGIYIYRQVQIYKWFEKNAIKKINSDILGRNIAKLKRSFVTSVLQLKRNTF